VLTLWNAWVFVADFFQGWWVWVWRGFCWTLGPLAVASLSLVSPAFSAALRAF